MPICRVQAIFEHENGLARDAVVNTFHFLTDGSEEHAAEVATSVVEFFANQKNGQAHTILSYMATTHDSVYAKAYMVNDVIVDGHLLSNAGEPIAVTLPAAVAIKQAQVNLPSEVAVCLSQRNLTDVGTPRARRTGRVYLGPFNASVWPGGVNTIPRPDPAANTDFRLAAQALADEVAGAAHPWVIYSRPFPGRFGGVKSNGDPLPDLPARPAGSYHLVEQVWTDDAFDTQRRRGERMTAKVTLAI